MLFPSITGNKKQLIINNNNKHQVIIPFGTSDKSTRGAQRGRPTVATGPEALTTSGQHNGQFPWQLDAAPASDLALCAGAEGKSHKLGPT